LTAQRARASSDLQNNHNFSSNIATMAPSTPIKQAKRREWSTIRRVRFFDAFDSKEKEQGVSLIADLPTIEIPYSTARLWLRQRDNIGLKALRSTRKTSSILGRRAKVSAADLTRLTDQENPEHELHYTDQAKLLPGEPAERTLRHHCAAIGAKRFEKPFVTDVSDKNRPLRVEYGKKHERETLSGFWQWIWFTDKAHFQSIKL